MQAWEEVYPDFRRPRHGGQAEVAAVAGIGDALKAVGGGEGVGGGRRRGEVGAEEEDLGDVRTYISWEGGEQGPVRPGPDESQILGQERWSWTPNSRVVISPFYLPHLLCLRE